MNDLIKEIQMAIVTNADHKVVLTMTLDMMATMANRIELLENEIKRLEQSRGSSNDKAKSSFNIG